MLAVAVREGGEGGGAVDAGRRHGVELFDFRKTDVDLRRTRVAALCNKLGQAVQGLRAEHDIDVRGALDDGVAFLAGNAAAHTDDQVGVALLQVLHSAQIGKHFFLRFFAHGTGVKENDVGFVGILGRSEEHTSELQSLMRISYAVFCLKKKKLQTYTDNAHF